MLTIALTAALAGASAQPDWRSFDRRPSGWADSDFEYDAGGLTRRGEWLRLRYRYTVHTSGVPDYRVIPSVELDCARRLVRTRYILYYGGIYALSGRQPYRQRSPRRAEPIAPDSIAGALARAVCPAR